MNDNEENTPHADACIGCRAHVNEHIKTSEPQGAWWWLYFYGEHVRPSNFMDRGVKPSPSLACHFPDVPAEHSI